MKEKFDIYIFIPNSTKETKYNLLLFIVYVPTHRKITLQRKLLFNYF